MASRLRADDGQSRLGARVGSSASLPADIEQQAAARLAVFAGIAVAFTVTEALISHGIAYLRRASYPTSADLWDLLGVALVTTTSLLAFVILRSERWPTSGRLRIGIAYLVIISYLVSLTDHADHFWQGGETLRGVPVIAMLIMTFPVIVPMRPLKALVIGLLMAATGPPSLFTLELALGYETPSTNALISSFPFLAPVVAAALGHIVHQLGVELGEARMLGQYVLGQKLGEGGMGAVYAAHHALMRRPTAVKLLPLEKAGRATLARFEQEVQLSSQLTHPNTITIYDYGRTAEGVFYYAMELLDGATLAQIVDGTGPLPADRVIHILRQVAGALCEAHGAGLIHRDVKPANIMLVEQGGVPDQAKLLDFGLVKKVDRVDASQLTHADAIMGTPQYMAPEAITAPEAVDARSDIYALGSVGYFMLTGEHVFTGASVVEVCAEHLHADPVPPRERLGKPVPPDLERLLLDCLAKDPGDRPQTAAALQERLGSLRVGGSWSEEKARAWWKDFREKTRGSARARAIPSSNGTTAMYPVRHTR